MPIDIWLKSIADSCAAELAECEADRIAMRPIGPFCYMRDAPAFKGAHENGKLVAEEVWKRLTAYVRLAARLPSVHT